jgi:hypothetical protein
MRITRLAETAFPLEVNSLYVDADGELNRIDPRERPFGFRFECLGLRFAAVTRVRKGTLLLQLVANVGPVPYTAESQDRRRDALAIIRSSLALPHINMGMSRDRQIEIVGEFPLPEPLTPVSVVSAAAELVLEIKPYITLLADFVPAASPRPANRA